VDRKSKDSLLLPRAPTSATATWCSARSESHGGRYGPKKGKLLEIVGREDEPRAASLIAIHAHGIPMGFSAAAEAGSRGRRAADLSRPRGPAPGPADHHRSRRTPATTTTPVYAEPDPTPSNPGGWICWVAIADVAAYVRPGSELDRIAHEKGNSVYFPDRVEPMLPERLSNGLCSLREGENRACLAVRMVFGADGRSARTGSSAA
jgi:ribonuclease R